MNTITERQLLLLENLFDERVKSETTFKGYRIVVEESVGEFDYEILVQDFYNKCQTWHTDEGFKTVEDAREAAESYIDNWEPNTDNISSDEGMSFQEKMANYQRLK